MSVLELNGRVFDASTTGTLTLTGEGGAATTDVTQGLAKGWCVVDQDDHSIKSSLNTTSVTDTSLGQTTVTVTNAMSDANYAGTGTIDTSRFNFSYTQVSSTSFKLSARNDAATFVDCLIHGFAFGDLA